MKWCITEAGNYCKAILQDDCVCALYAVRNSGKGVAVDAQDGSLVVRRRAGRRNGPDDDDVDVAPPAKFWLVLVHILASGSKTHLLVEELMLDWTHDPHY